MRRSTRETPAPLARGVTGACCAASARSHAARRAGVGPLRRAVEPLHAAATSATSARPSALVRRVTARAPGREVETRVAGMRRVCRRGGRRSDAAGDAALRSGRASAAPDGAPVRVVGPGPDAAEGPVREGELEALALY